MVVAAIALAFAGFVVAAIGAEDDDALLGGAGSVFDDTRSAFSLPARTLLEEHRSQFFVGNSLFNQNWVEAPASVAGRDGLGPLFNERSCSGCHFKDGRSQPPVSGEPMREMLLRISVPGRGAHGEPKPDPVYGDQIQGDAISGVPREANVFVTYEEEPGVFADGEPFVLRRPRYQITDPGYGPLSRDLLISPRVSPSIIGLGLLEAIPGSTLLALADPDDTNHDGVSGRVNEVWDAVARELAIGRFGWKAEQPSVEQQTAGAFLGDMGITSPLFATESQTPRQKAAAGRPTGGEPEIADHAFRAVVLYARSLAVPAARTHGNERAMRGRQTFRDAGCAVCHIAQLSTGASTDMPEFARQTIRPYTDLLLHDMGESLADNRPAFAATGREWRTPPLWGLGLISKVNGHTNLLHDGRARNASEAILWHRGEGERSRQHYISMPKADRLDLLAFLDSI